MNKLVFILGMRRSGTSILRKLIMQHSEVKNIEFEPHEFFFVLESLPIKRYQNLDYHKQMMARYKGHKNKYYGNKIALNPGIEAMRWKRIPQYLSEANYVFIERDVEQTYKSWCRIETSARGLCSYELYKPWRDFIVSSFYEFMLDNPDKAVVVKYRNLLRNADKEMTKVWKLLDIPIINGLNKMIKNPQTK